MAERKKDYTTAIIVQPPKELWGPIQAIRQKHDKVFNRWMPHVNLIFPFVVHSELAGGAEELAAGLANFEPFKVKLASFNHFEHSSNCVMWLDPQTDRPKALNDLQSTIERTFPYCDDQGKKSEHGFTPHLTVGQFTKKNIEQDKAKFLKGWAPIEFEVKSVYIIKREGDTPFEIAHEVKFGDKNAVEALKQKEIDAKTKAEDANKVVRPLNPIKTGKKITGYKYELPGGESVAVEFKFTKEDLAATGHVEREVVIALDKSGSMFRAFKDAKEAVKTLIKNLRERSIKNIKVIFYSSASTTLFTENLDMVKINTEFDKISASGGTNFADVFGYLASLSFNTNNSLAVVFFSDGQDTSDTTDDKKFVKQAFDLVKRSLTKGGIASEVHSLGFTPDHDAALLGKIATLGTTQGSFQYIKETSGIAEAIETTTNVIAGNKIACSVETSTDARYKLLLDDENVGVVVIPKKEIEKGSTILFAGNNEFEVQFESLSEERATALKTKYIEAKIQQLTTIVVNNPPKDVLEKIRLEADAYDEIINSIIKDSFKLPNRDVRKKQIQDALELKDVVAKFLQILSEAMSNTLTNDKIATFTSLTYKNVTKKGLQKKLDKTAAKNVNLYEEMDSKIDAALDKINFKELKEKADNAQLELYTCALSMKDYLEAVEDRDCMCITLSVGRSQAAIADPTQLDIKAVNQTFMTADTFMESAKYAVESAENPESTHGGFNKGFVASLVKGLAREDISGCMPLYISAEHWSVAKHKMKPIMGWITTLDVMGYTYSQVKTVPFLVLARVLLEAATGSEFKRKQFDMVLQTCQQIYIETPSLKEELPQLLSNYITDPAARTIDVITNNWVFLGQLLCAIKNGDIKFDSFDINKFFEFMVEEEIRRRMNAPWFKPPYEDNKYELFGVDKYQFVTKPADKFDDDYVAYVDAGKSGKSASIYSASIRALVDVNDEVAAKSEEKTEDKPERSLAPPKLVGPDFDGKLTDDTNAKQFVAYITTNVTNAVHGLLQFKNLLQNGEVKYDYTQPIFSGIEFPIILALYVQNFAQKRNSDRRDAITNKRYLDPFVADNSTAIIRDTMMDIVKAERASCVNDVTNREAAKNSGAIGDLFAFTTDVYEAAGILKSAVVTVGNKDKAFSFVINSIAERVVPLALEKLTMLITGEFKGIPVLTKKSVGPVGWMTDIKDVPRHKLPKRIFRIWNKNNAQISLNDIKKLMPSVPDTYYDKVSRIYKLY